LTPRGYFIDSNLLLLYIVGSQGRDLIARHRRLEGYSVTDYELLIDFLALASEVLVTPNTLTETSNLIRQHREPQRSQLMGRLRAVIQDSQEVSVASLEAADNPVFESFGLTDAVLLEVATAQTPLLTVDSGLCRAVLEANGLGAAVNFMAYRDISP
jgi:hypothetical protein